MKQMPSPQMKITDHKNIDPQFSSGARLVETRRLMMLEISSSCQPIHQLSTVDHALLPERCKTPLYSSRRAGEGHTHTHTHTHPCCGPFAWPAIKLFFPTSPKPLSLHFCLASGNRGRVSTKVLKLNKQIIFSKNYQGNWALKIFS